MPAASYAGACQSYVKQIRNELKSEEKKSDLGWLPLVTIEKKLGNGKKSELPEGVSQYDWVCPENSLYSLTVTIGANGKITTVTGKYSDENGAEEFSSIKKWTPVTSATSNRPSEEVIKQNKANFINVYNNYFKSKSTSFDQTSDDALARVKAFYSAIQDCKPGTYQYVLVDLPGYVFYTSVIKGKQNDECVIESTFVVPGKATGTKVCQFKPMSQLLFTQEQADYDGAGNFSFNSAEPTPIQQAESNECKYIIDEPKK